jgi:hypothetical protein
MKLPTETTSQPMKSFDDHPASLSSDILMDCFLNARSASGDTLREEWLARQTMLSLLRLARSEQLLSIRRSVTTLVPLCAPATLLKRPKSRRGARKQPGQTQLVFGRED